MTIIPRGPARKSPFDLKVFGFPGTSYVFILETMLVKQSLLQWLAKYRERHCEGQAE